MQKKPFTQAGFESLQAELYALDDALLQLEADAIVLNFKGWMYKHFDLTLPQMTFMDQIDQRCIYFLETQTSFAVNNRLPISLAKGEPSDDEESGKVIKPKSSFTVTAGNNGNMVVEGDLHIQIYYQS